MNCFNMTTTSEDLYCPISKQIFCNPVIASDGHTYEKESLEKWLSTKNTSPMTREPLKREYSDSDLIKKFVDQYIENNPHLKSEIYKPAFTVENLKDLEIIINNSETISLKNLSNEYIAQLIIKFDTNVLIKLINKLNNLEYQYQDNWKLIHFICKYGNPKIIKYILDKNIDLECQTLKGMRPIHFICSRKDLSIDTLIDITNHEVNVSCSTIAKIRPIHYLCEHGSATMIKYMMSIGTDLDCVTKSGMYPYDYLIKNKKNIPPDLKKFLLSLKKN